jgi:phosphoglycolate phosphatase
MKRGLIFDLDGTLVDSLMGIASSLNNALLAANLPTHGISEIRGFIGNGARILVTRAAPAGSDSVLIDRLETAFKTDYDTSWPTGTLAYDGIPRLLATLQSLGYPLAVLSNKPHPFTRTIVEQIFPDIAFNVVMGQLPGIPHKPDPNGALEIANLMNLLPESCTIIGDSTMDLETARNAGMEAIAVTWGYHDRRKLEEAGGVKFANDTDSLLEMLV